jgi:hypothetical protein
MLDYDPIMKRLKLICEGIEDDMDHYFVVSASFDDFVSHMESAGWINEGQIEMNNPDGLPFIGMTKSDLPPRSSIGIIEYKPGLVDVSVLDAFI